MTPDDPVVPDVAAAPAALEVESAYRPPALLDHPLRLRVGGPPSIGHDPGRIAVNLADDVAVACQVHPLSASLAAHDPSKQTRSR